MLLETRIPVRYILQTSWLDIATVFIICLFVEINSILLNGHLPDIPVAIPAFLGTAISLLLSFKLNQSYDRWWEARKIWGAIVNDSRTFVRQLLSFTAFEPEALIRRMGQRQIAWCYCLGQSLRNLDWRSGAVENLSMEDSDEATRHTNKPLVLLQQHARDLALLAQEGRLTDYQRMEVDATLTRLTDSMGKAERIRNTVFPRTYRTFLHIFIYIFITILSISLNEIEGSWEVLVTSLIAIPFFLLEKTATQMQDPFANRPTDTSVSAIARTIDINLRQLMNDRDIPKPLESDDYFIM